MHSLARLHTEAQSKLLAQNSSLMPVLETEPDQATFSDSSLKEQKRYNLSELSGDNTLKNKENVLENEELMQKHSISFMTTLFKEQEEQSKTFPFVDTQ